MNNAEKIREMIEQLRQDYIFAKDSDKEAIAEKGKNLKKALEVIETYQNRKPIIKK